MDVVALALVVVSALLHAGWNLLLKGARDRVAFVWWYLLVPMVLFAPLALGLSGWRLGPMPLRSIGLGVVSGMLQAGNLLAMSHAYRRGDLSVVYPLARSLAQVLIVALGVGWLGEELSAVGCVGIALVLVGVYTVFLRSPSAAALLRPFRRLLEGSSLAALAAGVTIALYHVIDKQAIQGASQYQYILLLFFADFCTVTVVLALRRRWDVVREEWRRNGARIVAAGSLSLVSYLLVLFALSRERVAYVGPARNMGIVFSVLLGALFLRERHGRMRFVGSVLIVAGLALASVAG
ncbi:MAG: EamA family transporter [bacterium]